MPLITTANFPGLVPDVGGAIRGGLQTAQGIQGLQAGRQQLAAQKATQERLAKARGTQAQVLGVEPRPEGISQDQSIAQLFVQSPELAEQTMTQLGLTDQRKRGEAARFAFELQDTPQEQRLEKIQQRVQQFTAEGRDPTDTVELSTLSPEEQDSALKAVQLAVLKPEDRAKIAAGIGGANLKAFAPVTLVDPVTREKMLVSPTFDPKTGTSTLAPFDIPDGFQVSTETPEEKRQADVLAKGAGKQEEVKAKGLVERRQAAVDKGLDMAEGFANIQRGLDLLDFVPTGGIDAASLKAKQFFGVEGADEAELSNRLSKAVLSQLKATFGAQFTVEEGRRLEVIEAGFGKSTEGNKRLLLQTQKLIKRAARRGIRAAEALGDEESAQDIRDALEFRLDISSPAVSQAQPVGQQVGRFTIEVLP